MADQDRLLASDGEREAVAHRLNVAAGEGRLTLEEFGDRVGAAYAARTRGELNALLDDLPAPAAAGDQLASAGPRQATVDRTAARAVQSTPIGTVKRSGRWRLGPDTGVDVTIGTIKLDLRGAELAAPEVNLTVRTVLGTIKVWIPRAIRVQVEGDSVIGGRRIEENHMPPHVDAPTLRLRLDTVIGTVKVYRV